MKLISKFQKSNLTDERGQITLDFLFATVLILGVATLLCALTIVLSLTEVLQYVSFSAARAYFAGDTNIQIQTDSATAKATKLLRELPFLRAAVSNQWIKVTPKGAANYKQYAEQNLNVPPQGGKNQFVGYQLQFEAPILGLKLPLLGNIVQSPDGNGFKATVASYLLREPTFDECRDYNSHIFTEILRTSPGFQRAASGINPNTVLIINDNGC